MKDNIGTEMLAWWNEAAQSSGFTAAGFAQFFTPTAPLVVNGEVRARGVEGLATHFQSIRKQADSLRIVQPVLETFATASRVFVHYRVEASLQGTPMAEEAMGYLAVENGKITLMSVFSRSAP